MRVDGKTTDIIIRVILQWVLHIPGLSDQSMTGVDGLLESVSRWSSSPREFPYQKKVI